MLEKKQLEHVILVGIRHPKESLQSVSESLFELERLAHTAGAWVVATTQQEVKKIDPATYIGKGKVEELKEMVEREKCPTVLFDEELSPRQQVKLENHLKTKVVDRSCLILDIFAQHATTREGKLQVELAQYIYLMPRMVGRWEHFGRLGGGIGTQGPGETQLEVDRRRAREKMGRIRGALKRVERYRNLHRKKREGIPVPTVALVGYTNAGKSSLMNLLTNAKVLTQDQLFATLDPTVRQLTLPSNRKVLLSDTVGFIRRLPHQLIEAFKATFEEVRSADLLLHVIDVSSPTYQDQMAVVESVLKELDLDEKPMLEVYNKVDLLNFSAVDGPGIRISTRKNLGIDHLLEKIEEKLSENFKLFRLKIPYEQTRHLDWLYRVGEVKSRKDREDGVYLKIGLSAADESRVRQVEDLKVKTL